MAERYQPAFGGGEISPILYGRTDLARYGMSLKTARNFIVLPQGGVTRRPGLQFVTIAKLATNDVRLVPFQYNYQQAYVLEMGNDYFRIIKEGASVLEPSKVITGITAANPGVVTSAAHGFSNGDWVYMTGIVGMTELNAAGAIVAGVTANTFQLTALGGANYDTSGFTSYVSGGTAARYKTVTTTYTEAELPEVKVGTAQSADVMTVCHKAHAPAEIVRGALGDYDFSIGNITFAPQVSAPTSVFATQAYQYAITAVTRNAAYTLITTTTSAAQRLNYGEKIYIANVVGTTQLNNRWFILLDKVDPSAVPTDLAYIVRIGTLDGLDIDSSGYTAYTSGGNIYTEEVIRYKVTAVSDDGEESLASTAGAINYSLAPSEAAPISIKWTPPSQTCKSFNVYKEKNGVYGFIGSRNDVAELLASPKTITGITAANPGVVTATAHGFINGDRVYISGVVGMTQVNGFTFKVAGKTANTFQLNSLIDTAVDTSAYTAYSSGGTVSKSPYWFVDDNIEADLLNTAPPSAATNPFAAAGDYPSVTCFHEQRRMFGRTNSDIQQVKGTQVGNIYNMNESIPSKADDAISFTLPSTQANEIRHMIPLTDLSLIGGSPAIYLFTSGSEWISTGNEQPYTIENIRNRVASGIGCAKYPAPQVIAGTILFPVRTGNRIWDIGYHLEGGQSPWGEDRTIYSEHLFDGKQIVDWCYQHNPLRCIWCVLDDGTAAAMTYLPEHQIYAWTRHDTPNGKFKSVCCVPEGDEDVVYFAIQRSDIVGSTLTTIERMGSPNFDDLRDANYVDFGVSYDSPMAMTGATAANPVVITTSAAHGLSDGNYVDVSDVLGMTELNNNRYRAGVLSSTTFALVTQYPSADVAITGITRANPAVVTAPSHGFSNGNTVRITDVLGMTQVNNLTFTVANKTTDTFELSGTNSSGYDEYIGEGAVYIYPPLDKTITGITKANPAVVTSAAHGLVTDQIVLISGVLGMTQVNGFLYRVGTTTTNTFSLKGMVGLPIDSTGYTTYSSGGTAYLHAYINGTAYTAYDEGGYVRQATTTIFPVGQFTGGTVDYLADGAVGSGTVANNTLTLDIPASRVHIGRTFTSEIETLDMNDPGGHLTGKKRTASEANVRYYRTRGGVFGTASDTTKPIKHDYDADTLLSTGEVRQVLNPSVDDAARVYVAQSDPLPMTIQAILTSFKDGKL